MIAVNSWLTREFNKWSSTEVASWHNNRTFLAATGALLFLLSACSVGQTQTMPSGIRVEVDHHNPFILRVELKSGAENRVTIYKSRLPWGSAYGMILLAVKPDGQIIKKELPVDDPSPNQVSLNPKESLKGEIDLRKIFRGLDEALRQSDIQLFWAYEAPDELHIPRWSGGWILIQKQK
jgi:hypothetical protein